MTSDFLPQMSIKGMVHRIIALRRAGARMTLLAVCPNSDAVLEAAVKVAAANNMPMLFAATLNQVDRDGGYTGWTPRAFVTRMSELAARYRCSSPLYPCLDHGGPWLKDAHTRDGLSLEETMAEVKVSLTACLEAGYAMLHVDPTVDRTLREGEVLPIDLVVERTAELIAYAESERERLSLPPASYEVGTEEVHGGLVDLDNFDRFLAGLRDRLQDLGLMRAWPCFIVGKVGTDLHTTTFDPESARRLYERVAPLGSLIKGHYTDNVSNPEDYPASGMGGANVGPEFTEAEYNSLKKLSCREEELLQQGKLAESSGLMQALADAVVRSGRWEKWRLPEELGKPFSELSPQRREWLVRTGCRYIWTEPDVLQAREKLYRNLSSAGIDAESEVIENIIQVMNKYFRAFNLEDTIGRIEHELESGL